MPDFHLPYVTAYSVYTIQNSISKQEAARKWIYGITIIWLENPSHIRKYQNSTGVSVLQVT